MPEEANDIKATIREEFEKLFGAHAFGGRSDATEADPVSMTKHVGQFNLKALVDESRELNMTGQRRADLWFQRIFGDTHSHISRLQLYGEQLIKDCVTNSKQIDARTLLHVPTHDFAFNRTWTFIDELVASLSAKTGVQQDVVVSALIDFLVDKLGPIIEAQQAKKKE